MHDDLLIIYEELKIMCFTFDDLTDILQNMWYKQQGGVWNADTRGIEKESAVCRYQL